MSIHGNLLFHDTVVDRIPLVRRICECHRAEEAALRNVRAMVLEGLCIVIQHDKLQWKARRPLRHHR